MMSYDKTVPHFYAGGGPTHLLKMMSYDKTVPAHTLCHEQGW